MRFVQASKHLKMSKFLAFSAGWSILLGVARCHIVHRGRPLFAFMALSQDTCGGAIEILCIS
jgi:hypothetical protein